MNGVEVFVSLTSIKVNGIWIYATNWLEWHFNFWQVNFAAKANRRKSGVNYMQYAHIHNEPIDQNHKQAKTIFRKIKQKIMQINNRQVKRSGFFFGFWNMRKKRNTSIVCVSEWIVLAMAKSLIATERNWMFAIAYCLVRFGSVVLLSM